MTDKLKKRIANLKTELYKANGDLWKLKKYDPKYKAANRKVNKLKKAISNCEFILRHANMFDTIIDGYAVCNSARIAFETLHVKFYGLEGTFNYSQASVLAMLNKNQVITP